MDQDRKCVSCNRTLIQQGNIWYCLHCNPEELETDQLLSEENIPDDYVFIECPGATLYQQGTNNIIAGVKFLDDNDPFRGYKIIGEPVYAPTHKRRRLIKREALGKIRRCHGCQDYTVRMRRKEGADFFIPSSKHPRRSKLKSVKHHSSEPR